MPRRSTLGVALAVAAFLCAALGALGPAKHLRTRYSWPPRELPAAQPDRLWYTPLLLARHEPQSLAARLPCQPPPALTHTTRPVTVLATGRDAVGVGALAVTRRGRGMRVAIGHRVLTRLDLPSGGFGRECAFRLLLTPGRWSVTGGPGDVSRSGSLGAMPIVNGLFSGLDLRAGAGPTIEVTTTVHGTATRIHQKVLWSAAALAAAIALLLVAVGPRPRRPRAIAAGAIRRAAARAGPADAAVAVALLGWWLIGPAFFDDGWVIARQQNFSESGGFSAYYTSFGVNLPLDYWLEWAEHWFVLGSSALLVARLPALFALGATWVLCRWILSRASPGPVDRVVTWALVAAFAVGAMAWGMTARPEPVVALLVTGVLACTLRFLERQTAAPLAVAAVLVALALSAHPAGLVALAPLIVAGPRLAAWIRARVSDASTIAIAAAALLGVLVFIGSDLQQRRDDAVSLRTYGDETAGWRQEVNRYGFLSRAPYGAPLRRESVALIFLAVLAFVLRRRRGQKGALLDVPAASLGVALLLLIATPTKWPWHFGALIGLLAAAVASETARLRIEARASNGWQALPFVVVGAAMLAAAWSWFPRNSWGDLDLRTLDWTLGIEERVTLAKAAGIAPVVLLVGFAGVELGRRRARRMHDVPWRAAVWTAPVLAIPLIAFTTGVLVADAAKTTSWTLTRANVATLAGNLRCGLADDALVAIPASMRALTPAASTGISSDDRLPPPPVRGLPRFTLQPAPIRAVRAPSPWFALPSRQSVDVGLFVGGAPGSAETLELEWGRSIGGRIESLSIDGVSADFKGDARPKLVPWRFFAARDLPSRPDGSNEVRFALSSEATLGSPVAIAGPVTYENGRFVDQLESRGSKTLVLPNLVTYVPCVRQPRLRDGVAEVPGRILAFRDSIWPLATGTSPFDGVFDLYQVRRLPLTLLPEPSRDVAVYDVDSTIPGAERATPQATLVS